MYTDPTETTERALTEVVAILTDEQKQQVKYY